MIDHITAVFAAEGLPPNERLLLLAYAHHTDAHGYCWPSIERLVDETGLSRATIKRVNRALREKFLIASAKRTAADGRQITNLTRLNVARLRAMARKDRTYDDNLIEKLTFPEDPEDQASPQVTRGAHSEPPPDQDDPPGGLTVSPPPAHCEPPGGLTVSPKPSQEPSIETSSSSSAPSAPAREPEPCQEQEEATTMETALSVVDAATAMWGGHRRPTASERLKLAERAAEALSQGARQTDLVHALSRDLSDARSAVAVVMARTAAADWWRGEVAPAAVAASATLRPEWCGECESPHYRWVYDSEGRPGRCPNCNPHADQPAAKPRQDAEATAAPSSVVSGLEEFRRKKALLRRA